jgi:Ni,Fe-hydrogenase I large subunit
VQDIAHADPLVQDAPQDPLLSSGALALGEGSAMAWCEMARGLLVHWVQVDASGGVLDYRVLAPTEWNFHPQGALAQVMAGLSSDDVRSARCLAAAFDACVDCRIESEAP